MMNRTLLTMQTANDVGSSRIPKAESSRGALWLWLLPLCVCQVLSLSAHGLNPATRISQFGHTPWRSDDGIFGGTPAAVAQTRDGYLWIGTSNGLVRFDGVRFVPFHPPSGKNLASPNIFMLLAGKDGSLWIGTQLALERWKDGELTTYTNSGGVVKAIVEAPDGTIWATEAGGTAKAGGPVCRVQGLRLRCYGTDEGLYRPDAQVMTLSPGGELWVDSGFDLEAWRPGGGRKVPIAGMDPKYPFPSIDALVADPDGSIWIGIGRKGVGGGLQHMIGDKSQPLILPGFDSSDLQVNSLYRDREGALWIGTMAQGVYRLYGNHVDNFRATDGLSGDYVVDVREDNEGDIWVLTTKGLDRFRDLPVTSFSTAQGLASGAVRTVVAARDGTIWAGADSFLEQIRNGKVTSIDRSRGLPGADVASMFEDHLGRLWLGVDNSVFVYSGNKFTEVRKADGQPIGPVQEVSEDTDGVMWAKISGPQHTDLYRWKSTEAPTQIALPGSQIATALKADPAGGMWVATRSGGLALYRKGEWKTVPAGRSPDSPRIRELAITEEDDLLGAASDGVIGWRKGKPQKLGTANGLPCLGIYSIVLDRQQTLWVFSQCGLVSIAKSELQRWWRDPDSKLKVGMLDVLDGAHPMITSLNPKNATLADGKIWFANSFELQQFDPLHVVHNSVLPPVHIEAVIADRREYDLKPGLKLPALTRDMEIDYTALSFPIPQRVQFRYRLDGWDTDWQDAATRRQVFYTNLRPGTYTFHVIACNNDGLWNDTGATVMFSILPAFYQTPWFRLLSGAAVLGTLWMFYLIRLNQITGQLQQRLGARMEERERIARELHDTLLQGVQGLMLRFQAAMKGLPEREPARQMMEQVLDRADEVLLEGRQRVRDLRAEGVAEADLPDRLSHCAKELAETCPIAFNLIVSGIPRILDPIVHNEVYQIAREALTNAFHHSNGTRILAEITYDQTSLRVVVRDDGRGIEEEILGQGRAGHWGLSGMRERGDKVGAKLNVSSHVGKGTEIELVIPARLAYRRSSRRPLRRVPRSWTLFVRERGLRSGEHD